LPRLGVEPERPGPELDDEVEEEVEVEDLGFRLICWPCLNWEMSWLLARTLTVLALLSTDIIVSVEPALALSPADPLLRWEELVDDELEPDIPAPD